jgi:DNA invertase Pin-like site-specific DNA recombinase
MMTNEERERAKARGVRFGRKLKPTAHQRREALARREVGEALTDIARTFGVSHSTISKLAGVSFMQ